MGRRKLASGDIDVVRFADDIVVWFQSKLDAKRFWAELIERFRKFRLELHPVPICHPYPLRRLGVIT